MNRFQSAFFITISTLLAASLFTTAMQASAASDAASAATRPTHSTSVTAQGPIEADVIAVYGYKVVKTYPHDRTAFTQGLIFQDGFLYEGTGLRGRSVLRKVELETGNVLQEHRLADWFFGEGVTLWKDKLIQLTWQSYTGFVYDRDSFDLLGEFAYRTEGWGLTHDGIHLIMSDGTANLYFLDPETFEQVRRVTVRDRDTPRDYVNELEYIRGQVYANIWHQDRIAMISPETGRIIGWIELNGLLTPEERARANVLNGIAYDAQADRLFVTGKFWPKLFEIKLIPKP